MRRWMMAMMALGCGGSDSADDTPAKPEAPCEEVAWFSDQDADGFGNPFSQTMACEQPKGSRRSAHCCAVSSGASVRRRPRCCCRCAPVAELRLAST